MRQRILLHLQTQDPRLYKVAKLTVEAFGDQIFILKKSENLFKDLCESIVSQQLSVKAGDTIFSRVEDLFPERALTAINILQLKDEQLRAAGLSWAKVRYIKDLAQKVNNQEVDLEKLASFSEQEVIVELTKIKGIGRWTAEMFLMFALAREDVFSHGDLGLRNAIIKIYGLKNYDQKEVEQIIMKWSPYKTYVCKILWRSLKI